MTRLLTSVQWEILATVGIVALGLAAAVVWLGLVTLWRAVTRALDDPRFWV